MRSAHDREQRFRRLLALAADAYWEIDHDNRLVAATRPARRAAARWHRPSAWAACPGSCRSFGCDAETLDQLQADLGSRVPFRDLPVHLDRTTTAARAAYLVSGEPRFDERGVFKGYWGVARDVTDVDAARAGAGRHRDALPGTVHAHPDAAGAAPRRPRHRRQPGGGGACSATPTCRPMLGSDLLAAYESGDSRERARRRIGAAAGPAAGHRLAGGRLPPAACAGAASPCAPPACASTPKAGPAMLAIFVDDTERLAAEQAVRRSEAMLSHLVATSPDLITLTDTGHRPLRDGQPHLRAPHRLDARPRRWAAPRSSSASGPAPRTASASSR